jgi:16S rRNA (uracil1498-N3)-methyltransferase
MSRFYTTPETVKNDLIELTPDESHHVHKVMRMGVNDEIVIFDGKREYCGVIEKATAKKVLIKVRSSKSFDKCSELNITLAIGVPKFKKMDLIVQKATELGVKRIIPVITRRSVVGFNEKNSKKKISRWKQIAVAACKQCGRIDIPVISEVVDLDNTLQITADYDFAVAGCLSKKTESLKELLKKSQLRKKSRILVFVGPEGGFDSKEVKLFQENEIKTVSFGPRILRSETAVFYILSVLSYYLEGQ